ncbi:putative wall-associated receptor kinase-like 16 [Tasmannia lanceolata]|uniref:putative wall-associated receptor kinase-like 16 n=1 Tax=Tasmannia lanceolata TaxID=3420 RepID=UPI004064A0F5
MALYVLLQLLWLTTALASSIAKPGCQDKCGNITIPYPFGIGDPNCFINGWFNVTCNTTFDPPKPFLYLREIEVLEILLQGQIRLAGWMGWDCYSEMAPGRNWSRGSTNFIGTPYTFSSTQNIFTAIGCDTQAYIRGPDATDFTTGCISICANKERLRNGTCSGIGCCQTSIPEDLKYLEFFLLSYSNHTRTKDFSPCSYAFLVQKDYFNFSIPLISVQNFSDENKQRFPRVLDWVIGSETCEVARRNTSTYGCGLKSICNDSISDGYRCNCPPGFEGNPYLPNDCQDIDECKRDPNPCKRGICKNKGDGSGYICSCPKGKHGHYGEDGSDCKDDQFPTIQVVLGVCASLLFLLISSSWIYWGLRKIKLIKLKEKFFQQNGGLLLQEKISSHESGTTKIFTEEELRRATDNYDQNRIIGRGGYGTVYKGILADHRIVAIKKSRVADGIQIEQFINEISILLQINHRNVVKLLGCCLETEVPLLVYEFISNGTLFQHVHEKSHASSISWENRLRIASEAAGALAYLHSATSLPIIHRDVKSTNILLDENYTAKVSDFGASKLVPLDYTEITTLVQGTLGYLDPEYFQTSQLTEKSDVYSFGVVLLELLTGEQPVSSGRSEKERNLSMYFISSMKENRLFEILEKRVVDEGGTKQIYAVADLAKRCLRMRGEERPTMKEVVVELDGLRRLEVHPWVELNQNESEYLLGEPSRLYNNSQGVGKDSLEAKDILLELEMGR